MKTRLFVDAHIFDGKYQGTRTFVKGLYSHLKNYSDLEIYMGAFNIEKLEKEFVNCGFEYIKYKTDNKYARLTYEIPKVLKSIGADVSHFQYISPIIKTTKEIVTIHDILFRDFKPYFPLSYRLKNNYLFKRSAKKADLITTVSNYSKLALIEHFHTNPQKIHIIPNGIERFEGDLTKYSNIKEKYNLEKYILYVSRIEPRKNHLMLVKSYIELKLYKKNIKLVLIGKNDLTANDLINYLKSLEEHERKNILIIDSVSDEELHGFFKYSQLCIYPSVAEGFGIPPLESALLEKRTLCSNTTAMNEFAFFQNCLFDPNNKEELKRKIAFYLENENASPNLEEIANKIKHIYNWDNISKSFLMALEKTVKVKI